MSTPAPALASTGPDRAELGFAAFLAAAGVVVVVDGLSLAVPYAQSDTVGPRTLPVVVGTLLVVCAGALALDVLRGGHGEAETGEDVDLTHPVDWRVLLSLVAVLAATTALVDVLGWVLAGTLLYGGSVWSLGSRRLVRDGLAALLLSLASFYGFYVGLGIPLPAGILEGVL